MTLNCRGHILDLSEPKIMGILNATPDSFYDGGKYDGVENMKSQVRNMIMAGADIIDVGGMSSRPGAEIISIEEELGRVLPAINFIVENFPETLISIDTIHSDIARKAIEHGVHIINDISGGVHDPNIINVAVEYSAPYVMMHMRGMPKDMQNNPQYDDVVLDVLKYFNAKIREYRNLGLRDIIIDPGFGFGKSQLHNYTLLRDLSVFRITDCPILAGISRKSMIYKPLQVTAKEALNGTTALHMVALQNGAKLLRVHDVKEAAECIALFRLLYQGK